MIRETNKIFFSIILIISLLILIYIFYRSEIYWNGSKRSYYLIYYTVSSILIFFSIVTFFINQKIKQYLIILSITIIASLYLFEGYLTSLGQPAKEKLYEKQTGKKWDTRIKYEIYKDLKKTNNKITLNVSPNFYIAKDYPILPILPLSGISNSLTIDCNENGYYSINQSDRYGFNNPDTEWSKKEIQYLLVGDSFTYGSCVNRPNDIASVLRILSDKPVLNLGQSGNGPLIEYATLREYLNKDVKKVLWIYYEGNDLGNVKYERGKKILMNYLNNLNFTQSLKFKQNKIDNLAINYLSEEEKKTEKDRKKARENIIESENFKFRLIKFIKLYNTRSLIFLKQPQYSIQPAPVPEFKKILQLSKELVEKNNSKLYFVYLPEYSRYKKNYDKTNYNLVKSIVNGLNIHFIDMHKEVFEKEKDPLKFFAFGKFQRTGHFNIEGYRKVAEKIYKLTSGL